VLINHVDKSAFGDYLSGQYRAHALAVEPSWRFEVKEDYNGNDNRCAVLELGLPQEATGPSIGSPTNK